MDYIRLMSKRIQEFAGKNLEESTPEEDLLYSIYALLAISKGQDVTMKDIHDAWSVWCSFVNPEHKSLVPFDRLSEEVQELDRKYWEATMEFAVLSDLAYAGEISGTEEILGKRVLATLFPAKTEVV